jgi:hypothetical protein
VRGRALAVVIVIGALSGCGGDGDDTAGAPPTQSTTVAEDTTSATTTTTTTGDDDGGGGGGEQRARLNDPRTAVEAVLTSSDPGDTCARFVTGHYLQAAFGGPDGCIRAQSPAGVADQLDFKSVRVDGDRARAVVVPSGGPYDGERVTASLVRKDPGWAVDELDADVPVGP